jgi:hypothetical protein
MSEWGPRLERLIAEGRIKPPKRKGPLLPPLKMDLDDPEPLSRALDETREEWGPTSSE